MSPSYRYIVHGRVQGVYFRQSTRAHALTLGLHGWVMNRADGCVEGVASGAPEALDQLRQWLHRGPPAARVDAVEWIAEVQVPESGFIVKV